MSRRPCFATSVTIRARDPLAWLRMCAVGFVCAVGCKGAAIDGGDPRDVAAAPEPVASAPGTAAEPEPEPEPEPAPAPTTPAPARAALEMTFVGDVIFGRYRADGYDPIPDPGYQPFGDIAEQLAADVIVANLETPLVRDFPTKSPIASKYRFGASPEMAALLRDAGFTAVSLANNHAFDMRAPGMIEAPQILRELGVIPLGASRTEAPLFRVETVEKAGWRLGFVAVTTRRNAPHREGAPELPYVFTRDMADTLEPVVRAGRGDHDVVIVLVHWGAEYADAPSRLQRTQAKRLIDAGADLVVGHHPHVLQGVERHGDGLIAYSMGNFLFENTTAIPRLTGVLRVRVAPRAATEKPEETEAAEAAEAAHRSCIDKVVFHPAYIARKPTKHPVPATGGMGTRVRARMSKLSAELDATLALDGEDLVMQGWGCGPGPRAAPGGAAAPGDGP